MLPWIIANWNAISLVEQYVGSLEYRIGEQPGCRSRFASTNRFILELGHPPQFPH